MCVYVYVYMCVCVCARTCVCVQSDISEDLQRFKGGVY